MCNLHFRLIQGVKGYLKRARTYCGHRNKGQMGTTDIYIPDKGNVMAPDTIS